MYVANTGPCIQQSFKVKPLELSGSKEPKTLENFLSDLSKADRDKLITEIEVMVYRMRQNNESKTILSVSQLASSTQTYIAKIENVFVPVILNPQLLSDETFLSSISNFGISSRGMLEEDLASLIYDASWYLEIRGDLPPGGGTVNKDLDEYLDYKRSNGSILRLAA